MPTFSNPNGGPAMHIVGGEAPMLLMFATVPLTVIEAMVGRRACEVIGHPAFAQGTPNGELRVLEAIGHGRGGRAVEVVAIALSGPLDLTGTGT